MVAKASPLPSAHPPLGTRIDSGTLELVEVLGVGGYGVVYRAVDVRVPSPQSFAVKCLMHTSAQSQNRRQLHIREIALHQIASGHKGIVTLHKVVKDYDYTYIIMDYAPDHDLFTQILTNRRYLGDDVIIKYIFLQLLDAVKYIHSLGIYHRDLKPENILCFDSGYRVALTDFGLATTDKTSSEFRTGSVYHMSPECQGGEYAPTDVYSPRFNDIWSLGIILLNLATGRNPWKSATSSDPTFQAYLRDPQKFLPTVLPISPELNRILVQVLHVDWRKRMTLGEFRRAIENLDTFYSDGAIFEGSLARCPWEAGFDLGDGGDDASPTRVDMPMPTYQDGLVEDQTQLKSCWSEDSEDDDFEFSGQNTLSWSQMDDVINEPPWLLHSLPSPRFRKEDSSSECDYDDDESTPSITNSPTSPCASGIFSFPATPESTSKLRGILRRKLNERQKLTINTLFVPRPRYYDASNPENGGNQDSLGPSSSSSVVRTAVEYISYASSFYLTNTRGSEVSLRTPESIDLRSPAHTEDKDVQSTTSWDSGSVVPHLPSGSAMSLEMTFDSGYPSTGLSSPSNMDFTEGEPRTITGTMVGPPEYLRWPNFRWRDDSEERGGAPGVGSQVYGTVREGSSHRGGYDYQKLFCRGPKSFNPLKYFTRLGAGASSSTPAHINMPPKQHISETLGRFSQLTKQFRPETRYHNDTPVLNMPVPVHSWSFESDGQSWATYMSNQQCASQAPFPKLPPTPLHPDTPDHTSYGRNSHIRTTRQWFMSSRLFQSNPGPS
ncbi:hypothetical protein AMATHDRAFT_62169 [Amanita thiersii Skay4041]|uniref:Protein kinase domain-containing protein n=1 Tax=Amanita thiersii Skay4041 TaxID=703135 RepID=A0A2A9NIJ2_9AGAR|nr:hypothetical protein AMATHDRAFT_62169 [Amanita thiersii Skay4041]